jgi:hypothetical protein
MPVAVVAVATEAAGIEAAAAEEEATVEDTLVRAFPFVSAFVRQFQLCYDSPDVMCKEKSFCIIF